MDGSRISVPASLRGDSATLPLLSAAQNSSRIFSFPRHYCSSGSLGFLLASFCSLVGLLCFGALLTVGVGIFRLCRESPSHRLSYPCNCDPEKTAKSRQDTPGSADANPLLEDKTSVNFSSARSAGKTYLRERSKRGVDIRTMIMRTLCCLACILFGFYPFVFAFDGRSAPVHRQAQQENSSAALVDFQVYKPVEFIPESTGCNEVLLLMEHQFAFSYAHPFVGENKPAYCPDGIADAILARKLRATRL